MTTHKITNDWFEKDRMAVQKGDKITLGLDQNGTYVPVSSEELAQATFKATTDIGVWRLYESLPTPRYLRVKDRFIQVQVAGNSMSVEIGIDRGQFNISLVPKAIIDGILKADE